MENTRNNFKLCPFMCIADAIGYEGKAGVPYGNVTGACMKDMCAMFNLKTGKCGLLATENKSTIGKA